MNSINTQRQIYITPSFQKNKKHKTVIENESRNEKG